MAIRFSDRKTQRFYFHDADQNKDRSYVLIYGDEVDTSSGSNHMGAGHTPVTYRGRKGALKNYKIDGTQQAALSKTRALETYFLDVGQGDAAFVVTPNNTKILIDGGLSRSTAEFLIWKYRLDEDNTLTINHLFLSHADADHVAGLIPILNHPKITVEHVWHNGIGLYDSGHNEALGTVTNGHLITTHDTVANLAGEDLTHTFTKWIDAITMQGASYHALDQSMGDVDVGDPAIRMEIIGPLKEPNGSFKWLKGKSHTINGHSLMLRLHHGHARFLFSGDSNVEGGEHHLEHPGAALKLDSHVFKTPHHGSHEYHFPFLQAVRPLISVVSSGDSPDHGHPRASFLGAIGAAGRIAGDHLLFSTEIAATFSETGDAPVDEPAPDADADPDLMYSSSALNSQAHARFKKKLSGIINVRSDSKSLYAARRVTASYQWESYDPIDVTKVT